MKPSHAFIAFTVCLMITACEDAPLQTGARAPSSERDRAYDLQFLDSMSKHHADAVEMARLAQGKVQRAELKDLVRKIPVDQRAEIDQMRAWRSEWYAGEPVAEGEREMLGMDMSHLETMAPGPDYDAMFVDMMIPHHETAVQMSQEALTKAEREEVRGLARQIIDAQEREIAQMRAWKAAWGTQGTTDGHSR